MGNVQRASTCFVAFLANVMLGGPPVFGVAALALGMLFVVAEWDRRR